MRRILSLLLLLGAAGGAYWWWSQRTSELHADDPRLRKNRLQLLGELRAAMRRVADFSKIAG